MSQRKDNHTNIFFAIYFGVLVLVALIFVMIYSNQSSTVQPVQPEPVISYKVTDPSYIEVQSVAIRQEQITFLVGSKVYLHTTVYPENASDKTLMWSSSDPKIVSVSKDGIIQGVSEGEATITVVSSNGKVDNCFVVVKTKETMLPEIESVKLKQNTIHFYEQEFTYLRYDLLPGNVADHLTWTSSDPDVVSVSEVGKITGLKEGTSTITVTSSNGKSDTCEVTVMSRPVTSIPVTHLVLDKASMYLTEGDAIRLYATVLPSNATNKTITWSSCNSNIATVTNNGVVMGIKPGKTTILAKTANGIYASCYVVVLEKEKEQPKEEEKQPEIPKEEEKEKITPTPTNVSVSSVSLDRTSAAMDVSKTLTLKATVLPENATNKTIVWGSSNPSVATVSQKGVVKAISAGTTVISAFSDNGKVASAKITVKNNTPSVQDVVSSSTLISSLPTSGVTFAQIAVFSNGKVLNSSSYNTTNDVKYPISSASKSVLGIVAAKMEEEGIIDLDRKIEDYWHQANLYDYSTCTKEWQNSIGSSDTLKKYTVSTKHLVENPATLRNCLTHSSTIKNMSMVHQTPNDEKSEYFGGGMSKTYGVAAFMLAHTSHQLFEQGATPGTKTAYQYQKDTLTREHALAGFTMQIAMKESVNEFMNRELLKPLGCTSSPSFVGGNSVYFATSYQTSAEDLARIIAAIANDGVYQGKRVFDKSTITEIERVESKLNNQTIAFDSVNGKYVKYGIYSSISGVSNYKLSDIQNRYASYITYDPKTGIGFVAIIKYDAKKNKDKAYTTFESLSNDFYMNSK